MNYVIKDNSGNIIFPSQPISTTQKSQEGIGSAIAAGAAIVVSLVGLIAAAIAGVKSEEAAREKTTFILNNLSQEDKDILTQYINNLNEERYELSEDLDRIVKNSIPRDWRDLGFYYNGKINRSIYSSDVYTYEKENNYQMLSLIRCFENSDSYAKKDNLNLIPVAVEYPYKSSRIDNDSDRLDQSIMGKVMRVMRNVESEITKHFLSMKNIPNTSNVIVDITFANVTVNEPSTVIFSPLISFKPDKNVMNVLNKIYSLSTNRTNI